MASIKSKSGSVRRVPIRVQIPYEVSEELAAEAASAARGEPTDSVRLHTTLIISDAVDDRELERLCDPAVLEHLESLTIDVDPALASRIAQRLLKQIGQELHKINAAFE